MDKATVLAFVKSAKGEKGEKEDKLSKGKKAVGKFKDEEKGEKCSPKEAALKNFKKKK